MDEQWSFRDSIPGLRVSPFAKILVDASGNSYITGYELSLRSMFLKKVDSVGTLKWTKYYTDSSCLCIRPTAPRIMFFSRSGHIKIIGDKSDNNTNQIFLNEYDTSGTLIYNKIIADTVLYSNPSPVCAVIDSSENIYLGISDHYTTGPGTSGSYLSLVKYSPTGIKLPGFSGSIPYQGTQNDFQSMCIDSNRNITLINYSNGADITRLSPSGMWLSHIASPNAGQTQGILQSDKGSNIVYCDMGYEEGVAGSITKLDTSLNVLWTYTSPLLFYNDFIQDTAGNIYVCGQKSGYLIVQKISTTGILQWTYQFTISNHTSEMGRRIKISQQGSIYIQGVKSFFSTPNKFEAAIILQLDPSGNYISSHLFTEIGSDRTYPFDFELDSIGSAYVCGAGLHRQSFDYPFIYKLCNNYCNGNITGKRFTDANSNCLYDSSEIVLPAQVLLLKPNNIYATTNFAGYYHFKADSGNYFIKPILPLYWNTTCNMDSAAVNISSTNPGDTIDFGSLGFGMLNVNDLQVSFAMNNIVRPGFSQNSTISYYNVGTTNINNAIVQLNLDATVFNFVNSTPPADSVSGNNYFWHVGNLGLYAMGVIYVQTTVPSLVPQMTHFTNSIQIHPFLTDTTQYNNQDTIRGEVRGSCDPNQKTVTTTQYNYQNPLAPTQNELAYHIDFQNTGTDTAFTISVIDTIDTNLDIASLRFGASSHTYTWEVYGPGIIKFMFNNVLLPDSNVDEANSHGFVKYYIRPNAGLDASTSISNTANIFFDYNANVRTNTVYYPPILSHVNAAKGTLLTALNLFPNPAGKTLHISCSKFIKRAKIFDISGKLISTELLDAQLTINTSGLSSGIYFVDFFSDEEVFHAKFIKE